MRFIKMLADISCFSSVWLRRSEIWIREQSQKKCNLVTVQRTSNAK